MSGYVMYSWEQFKAFINASSVHFKEIETATHYEVFYIDGGTELRCHIDKSHQASFDDYNLNYRSRANKPVDAFDRDGVKKVSLDTTTEKVEKKHVISISPATEGWLTWLCGKDDAPVGTPLGTDPNTGLPISPRGNGKPFRIQVGDSGPDANRPITKTEMFSFIENMEVHDGEIQWSPTEWDHTDSFSFGVFIPATEATLEPSTGAYRIVTLPNGLPAIMPAPDNDGTHYVNLNTAVPVPVPSGTGCYDVDYESGVVTLNQKGKGDFMLFACPLKTYLIRNVMLASKLGLFDIDVYKTEWFHHRWKLCWEVTKSSAGPGTITGWVFAFRKNVA